MKKHTSKKQMTHKGASAKKSFAFYLGIDLGDKNSDVCVLDQDGELKEEFRLRMKAAE